MNIFKIIAFTIVITGLSCPVFSQSGNTSAAKTPTVPSSSTAPDLIQKTITRTYNPLSGGATSSIKVNVMHYWESGVNAATPTINNCPPNSTFIEGRWYPTDGYNKFKVYGTIARDRDSAGYAIPDPKGGITYDSNNRVTTYTGMFYYVCSETYSGGKFYDALTKNWFVKCDDFGGPGSPNMSNYTGSVPSTQNKQGYCSMFAQKPPIIAGLAPVPTFANHNIFDVAFYIRNITTGDTTNGTWDNMGYATRQRGAMPEPGMDNTGAAGKWLVLDRNPYPNPVWYQNGYDLDWKILGPFIDSDRWISSYYDQGTRWGAYFCYPTKRSSWEVDGLKYDTFGYGAPGHPDWNPIGPFKVTPAAYGQTCTFTCSEFIFGPYLYTNDVRDGCDGCPDNTNRDGSFVGTRPSVTCTNSK
jgi:hypothetical protein